MKTQMTTLFLCLFFMASCQKEMEKEGPSVAENGKAGTIQGAGTVTDIDGNVYKTVKIGNQVWMAENLRVTRYRNGDVIPEIQNSTQWLNASSGAWSVYNNDASNNAVYGKLYNGYAVNDTRGLAPKGWHIPTNDELLILSQYLGIDAGAKLKEAGCSYWICPNAGATNSTGFTARGGGLREVMYGVDFRFLTSYGAFWSANGGNYMVFAQNSLLQLDGYAYYYGLSVRCIKDSQTSPTKGK